MIAADEPAREGETVSGGVGGESGEEGGDACIDLVFGLSVFAAVVDEGRARVGGWAFAHGERGLPCGEIGEGVDFVACGGEFRGIEEEGLAELGAVGVGEFRVRDGEEGLGFAVELGGGGTFCGSERDAEAAERAGVVAAEDELE